jgi:hypothetical protein
MKVILIISLNLLISILHGQNFNDSHPCHVNVNQSPNFRDVVKRASFKIRFVGPGEGLCTGTLVNKDIGQNDLGFYFVTARHCIDDDNGNIDINLLGNHNLICTTLNL